MKERNGFASKSRRMAWMSSATCCGMESSRRDVWNHGNAVYGIDPKENTRWRVMPYAFGDYILTCGEMTYQSFGLDKKIHRICDGFFWQGQEDSNPRHPVLETGVLPTELYPYACNAPIIAQTAPFCKPFLQKSEFDKNFSKKRQMLLTFPTYLC